MPQESPEELEEMVQGFMYYGAVEEEDANNLALCFLRAGLTWRDIRTVETVDVNDPDNRQACRIGFRKNVMHAASVCSASDNASWFLGFHGTRPDRVQKILADRCLKSGDDVSGNEMKKVYAQMCLDDGRQDLVAAAMRRALASAKNQAGIIFEFACFCDHKVASSGGTYWAEECATPGVAVHMRGNSRHKNGVADAS